MEKTFCRLTSTNALTYSNLTSTNALTYSKESL